MSGTGRDNRFVLRQRFPDFISDSIDPKKYNLKKVYAVEKWLFAIDTLSLFGMAFHLGGGTGDLVLAAVVLVTLFAHVYVFKSRNFRV